MRRFVLGFLRRGAMVCGIGPIILAILYFVLKQSSSIETLSVNQVCIGIVSITVLAFVAGGMNAIYQIESLPLMVAIFIHGVVLYISYLATYLINDWLKWGAIPIVIFTVIFIVGYIIIWAIVYSIIKRNTSELNEIISRKQ